MGKYVWQADEGYRVSVCVCGGAIRYSSWLKSVVSPLRQDRYKVGETVPTTWVLLGVFDTAKLAKSACVSDYGGRSDG